MGTLDVVSEFPAEEFLHRSHCLLQSLEEQAAELLHILLHLYLFLRPPE
jgi:hypothetical protein